MDIGPHKSDSKMHDASMRPRFSRVARTAQHYVLGRLELFTVRRLLVLARKFVARRELFSSVSFVDFNWLLFGVC
jgi:hypothetical protein